MKTTWLSIGVAAVAATATSVVFGADLPSGNGFFVPPPYNWNGFYMGANLGAALASGSLTDNATGSSFSGNNAGLMGGGTIGYNWQFAPNWVLGGEGTFDGASISKLTGQKGGSGAPVTGMPGNPTQTSQIIPTTPPTTVWLNSTSTPTVTNSSLVEGNLSTNWASTIAARFGYTQPGWLIYGKAGVGFAASTASTSYLNAKSTNTATVTTTCSVMTQPCPTGSTIGSPTTTNSLATQVLGAGTASSSVITPGFLAGIGVEYALSYNWTIKAEYNYLGLSHWGSTGGSDSLSVNRQLNMFTIGMNYKFFN